MEPCIQYCSVRERGHTNIYVKLVRQLLIQELINDAGEWRKGRDLAQYNGLDWKERN